MFYGESKILAVKARGQCVNLVIINSKSAGQILVQSINRDARTTFMDPVVLSLLLTLGRFLSSVWGIQLSNSTDITPFNVLFLYPLKHQKIKGRLFFSGDIETRQLHEMD